MAMFESTVLISLPLQTVTSFVATGATTLVSAPGAGNSLVIDSVRIVVQTTTTNNQEYSIRDGGAGTLSYRCYEKTLGNVPLALEFTVPWVLDTNSSLQAVCSVTAASTPGAEIQVRYRILKRG